MNGALYYNSGQGCLLRLAVSLHSLRKHYAGPACILHEDDTGAELCRQIAGAFDAKAQVAKFAPPIPPGAHSAFVAKTRAGEVTPYDITVMLDADTLVRAPIDPLFTALPEGVQFAVPQFANWNTTGKIAKRIRGWEPYMPPLWINTALKFGRAINNGVTVFRKDSPFMAEWAAYALEGRAQYIPDESSLQVLVAAYPDVAGVLEHWWNTSCKYDDPLSPECKVIHYHGRKHPRLDNGKPIYHSDLWYAELEEFRAAHKKLAVALEPTDRHLRHYAREYKAWRAGK